MDFHAVHACIAAELRRLGKGLDDLVDLMDRHLGALNIGGPTGRLGAGRSQLMGGIEDGLHNGAGKLILMEGANQLRNGPAAAHTCRQLHEELGTRLMDLLHKDLQLVEHLGILPQPLAPEGITQGRNAGDDETHVVLGTLQKEVCRLLIEVAATQLEPAEQGRAAHGTHDNAVFDLHVAHLPRGKQRLVFLIYRVHTQICPFF